MNFNFANSCYDIAALSTCVLENKEWESYAIKEVPITKHLEAIAVYRYIDGDTKLDVLGSLRPGAKNTIKAVFTRTNLIPEEQLAVMAKRDEIVRAILEMSENRGLWNDCLNAIIFLLKKERI